MDTIYVVYEGDEWLSSDSMRVKGVASTFDEAVALIRDNHQVSFGDVFDDDPTDYDKHTQIEMVSDQLEDELRQHKQTFSGSVRYMIDEVNLNEWM